MFQNHPSNDYVPPLKNQTGKWDEASDIVVIGSGFAGLTAAIEASHAGASVIDSLKR